MASTSTRGYAGFLLSTVLVVSTTALLITRWRSRSARIATDGGTDQSARARLGFGSARSESDAAVDSDSNSGSTDRALPSAAQFELADGDQPVEEAIARYCAAESHR